MTSPAETEIDIIVQLVLKMTVTVLKCASLFTYRPCDYKTFENVLHAVTYYHSKYTMILIFFKNQNVLILCTDSCSLQECLGDDSATFSEWTHKMMLVNSQ